MRSGWAGTAGLVATTVVTVAVTVLGALGGCSTAPGGVGPTGAVGTAATVGTPRAAGTVTSTPTGRVTDLPTEPPLVLPTSPGPSTPVDPAVPLFPDGPCQPSQLTIAAGRLDAPDAGERRIRVRVTNRSDTPCLVTGYAVPSFQGTTGTRFANPVGRSADPEARPSMTLPLDPGSTAHVDIGWQRATAAGTETAGRAWVLVTEGSTPGLVDLTEVLPLELADGTAVVVGGWRPGPD